MTPEESARASIDVLPVAARFRCPHLGRALT
jgi:hypothetical protein